MKILVVNKHITLRLGITQAIRILSGYRAFESESIENIDESITKQNIELCIIDSLYVDPHNTDRLSLLKKFFPHTRIIISHGEDEFYDKKTLTEKGIDASISYLDELTTIYFRISSLFNGKTWLTKEHSASPSKIKNRGLTSRQLDVLRLVYKGQANKTIAQKLLITEGTVRIHLSDIYRALSVKNRTEAVHKALSLGVLTSEQPHHISSQLLEPT